MVELAEIKGVGRRTMFRYVAALKTAGKFNKKSIGRFYDLKEAKEIASLLDFKLV